MKTFWNILKKRKITILALLLIIIFLVLATNTEVLEFYILLGYCILLFFYCFFDCFFMTEKTKAHRDFDLQAKTLNISLLLLSIPFIIAEVILALKNRTLITVDKIKSDQYVTVFGALIAYLGTVFLGMLAYWQNERYKIKNDESQELLSEQNTKLLEINNRMLKIQEDSNKLSQSSSIYVSVESVTSQNLINTKEDYVYDDDMHFNLFVKGYDPILKKEYIDEPPKTTGYDRIIFKIQMLNFSDVLTRKITVEASTTIHTKMGAGVICTDHDLVEFGPCDIYSCVSKTESKNFELVLYLDKKSNYAIEHYDIGWDNFFRFFFTFESSFNVKTNGVLICKYNEAEKKYFGNYIFNGICSDQ